jgi:hypothetical protein
MFFSNILNLHNSLQIFSNNLKCLILILDDFVALLPRSTITVFSSSIIKKCAINTGRLPSTFSCHWRSICSLSGHTNHLQQPFYFLPSFLPSFPSFPPFLASPSSTLPIILLLIAGLIDRSIALLECTWHPNWRRAVGRGGTGRNSAQSRGTSHSPQLHAMQKCSGKTAPSIYTSCTRRNVDPPLATLARAPLCRPYVKAARKTVQTLVLQKGTCGFPPSMWKG